MGHNTGGVPVVSMIAVKDIVANPHRRIERYSYSEEKIERLLQSYENSGFWDGSIQGRESPTDAGKIEIAFGHHRVEAARRAKIKTLGIVIADRSEADMLRMMGDENAGEFKHDAFVGVETIRAGVTAYAKGQIELEQPAKDGPKAGQVILPGGKIYSLATVARFLGWVKPSTGQATRACQVAFDAFQQSASVDEALMALTPAERSEVAVETVTKSAKAARAEAEKIGLPPAKVREAEKRAARAAVKDVKEESGFKARTENVARGKAAVREVAGKKTKALPHIDRYAAKVIKKCEVCEPYAEVLTECRRLLPFLDDLDAPLGKKLAAALEAMLKRSTTEVIAVAKALRAGDGKKVTKLLEGGHAAA